MLEQALLGIIQGIVEWLPISSEGAIVLVKTHFFGGNVNLESIVKQALFLHFGTFLSALIYFRKDVLVLMKSIFHLSSQTKETQNLFSFLFIATLVSGALGFTLIKLLSRAFDQFSQTGKLITFLVGILLLITGTLELKAKHGGYKQLSDLRIVDGVILGVVQGFAALPGLSRSGLTVSALLLSKFDKAWALKLSFLMSLPIVLAGNIVLNYKLFALSLESCIGLSTSFLFGLATIHLLLKCAKKINFGYFVLFFGGLTLLSVLI